LKGFSLSPNAKSLNGHILNTLDVSDSRSVLGQWRVFNIWPYQPLNATLNGELNLPADRFSKTSLPSTTQPVSLYEEKSMEIYFE
jgi:hypothetical protein